MEILPGAERIDLKRYHWYSSDGPSRHADHVVQKPTLS